MGQMSNNANKYHLGLTGWSTKEWVGSFYRRGSKANGYLSQYSTVFNTVEGNTTFYSMPSHETIAKWNEQTPSNFKFCFKFPRSIIHIKRLSQVDREIDQFLSRFESMRSKLGPFMIQLPESFRPDELYKLDQLLSYLPKIYNYGVEVRHLDFFNQGNKEHVFESLLQSYGIERIIFDTRKLHSMVSEEPTIVEAQQKKPKVPVRFKLHGSRPMVRFVGSNDTLNNASYLKEWAIVVADWITSGKHPYIFIHTPDIISQPLVAAYFHEVLGRLIELPPLPNWPANVEQQLGLF